MYIGHKRKDGTIQPLKEHLSGVAELAGRFAAPFGGSDHARRAGLLHDAGKYSRAGQRRMANPEGTGKVDHSTAGAQIAWARCRDGFAALAVAGHHGGMPDFGSKLSSEGDGTLQGRVRRKLTGDMDYAAYWDENHIDPGMLAPQWLAGERNPFAHPFYARMLFSCLVDADFLDTERFMQGELPRGGYSDMNALLSRLEAHIQQYFNAPASEINRKRNGILQDCLTAGTGPRGLYTLTVPTGGGKTISSLAFALTQAVTHGMSRVIYVIPYTSIIEQNAAVFRSILGDENVVEHHSGVSSDEEQDMEDPAAMRRMLATENWDAPVIVTTAVQFFESLFSNRPSRCRKLHSIADSVVIFDEAQMLPLPYLKPCVAAIGELARHYGATAVLCTATQPALNGLFSEAAPGLQIREICGNVDALQRFFRRVRFSRRGEMDCASVAGELSRRSRALCVVNTRKRAQEIFALLPQPGSFHLSTRMTPDHRSRVLAEIRGRLKRGEDCRVVSTSLIEAGVDVDFPEVWRELAGLDSILQAAGRCNREGKRGAGDSEVVVFAMAGGVPKSMQPNATAAEVALEGAAHPDDSATIRRYFEQLYWQRGDKSLDAKGILEMCVPPMLKSMAREFHMIEDGTRTIYIPTAENEEVLRLLRIGALSRGLLRRLGRSALSVHPRDWDALMNAGRLECVGADAAILSDASAYDPMMGLTVEAEPGRGLWI